MNRNNSGWKIRLAIGAIIALYSLFSYYNSATVNPVTGEKQRVGAITPEQEIAMGLQSKPSMMQEYGGVHPDGRLRAMVQKVCQQLLDRSAAGKTGWQFECTLLADPQTINAFALPGGQTFITYALLSRLESEAQIAGVMGHEIGHVIARHGAQHIAKSDLTNGLLGAVTVASGSADASQMAAQIAALVNMKYGREDELESDQLGVQFMSDAGYDPRGMIRVMEILDEASGGGERPPEFSSTHPSPENRIQKIQEAIKKRFPNGVPNNLIK